MYLKEPVQLSGRKISDFDYIQKELQKSGINKTLL